MSARDTALLQVSQLDEATAVQLLGWLSEHTSQDQEIKPAPAKSALEMLGFARRYDPTPRTTAEWMAELREGEQD